MKPEEEIEIFAIGILNCEDLEFIKRRTEKFLEKKEKEILEEELKFLKIMLEQCSRPDEYDEMLDGRIAQIKKEMEK